MAVSEEEDRLGRVVDVVGQGAAHDDGVAGHADPPGGAHATRSGRRSSRRHALHGEEGDHEQPREGDAVARRHRRLHDVEPGRERPDPEDDPLPREPLPVERPCGGAPVVHGLSSAREARM